jgi:WD40 repeat protein
MIFCQKVRQRIVLNNFQGIPFLMERTIRRYRPAVIVAMSVDAHTEFEATTLAYALLQTFDKNIADEFYESAFTHEQTKENARGLLTSLPPQFIPSLIQSSCPDTTFRSIIQNPGPFPKEPLRPQERRSQLVSERVRNIVITHRLIGHTRAVHHIALDPLNILFFTGSDDSMIKCWHVPSMSLICTFKGHEDGVTGLLMSPDRRLLASWSEDKFLRLWSLVDGSAVAVISLFDPELVKAATFPPCGRYLAAISVTGQIKILRIGELIPCLVSALKGLTADGRIHYGYTIGDLLFPDGDYSRFEDYDPHNFLRQPPKVHRQFNLKAPAGSIAFSPGGNLLAATLASGSVLVLSMSYQRRWSIPQAHEAGVDGAYFLKNSFHSLLTWSQRGGDIKLWKFQEKSKAIVTFSVRTQSRRAHLVTVAVSCDECLVFACSSQAVFAWKIDNPSPILHNDDSQLVSFVTDVCANPVLPTVFMATCKSLITIWDACQPGAPIHQLIIPVETPRIQTARWAPDGLAVIASDVSSGVYVFRVSETPECRQMPQFFETDFTASSWIADRGQIEEANGLPIHRQSRSVLLDENRVQIYQDFRPYSLDELVVVPMFGPVMKYAWLNEELWTRRVAGRDDSRKELGPSKSTEDFDAPDVDIDVDTGGLSSDVGGRTRRGRAPSMSDEDDEMDV